MTLRTIVTLAVAASLAPAPFALPDEGGPPPSASELTPWEWSAKDLRAIEKREKKAREQDGVHEVRAGGWIVRAAVDARFAAEVSLFMERLEGVFEEVFPYRATVSIEPTVVVFGSKAEFERRFPHGERGYFHYGWSGKKYNEFHVYTYVDHSAQREFARFPYPVLQHEGAHALLRRVYGQNDIPMWYDEAVGAWFQAYDLSKPLRENREYSRYGRSEYFAPLRRLLGKYGEQPPPLSRLTDLDRDTWNTDGFGERTKQNYGLAETLGDYLLSHPEGRAVLDDLHEGVRRGKGREALSEKDLRRLEPAWQGHVQEVLYFMRDVGESGTRSG
ncbi:MAG: hypothetical protein ACF8XB_15550 [Planctomycetota bacterium JB042]